ncbi:GNAT family N-acetyltransferase [Yokenella regensburgei]|uniref:GNAT family N-acetyltransferase n=1 Tax=Yokenella regensburgei TaxID=158877 RepID=UPI003F161FCC
MLIRPVEPSDVEPLLIMLRRSGQFDEEGLLHVRERLQRYFSGETEEIWFSADQQGLVGMAYCAPEVMTTHVWNLLLLWITPSHQRRGIGLALLDHVEKAVKAREGRLLLVDTSSLSDYSAARAFYNQQGFIKEARIRDYYAIGEDKITFIKTMHP